MKTVRLVVEGEEGRFYTISLKGEAMWIPMDSDAPPFGGGSFLNGNFLSAEIFDHEKRSTWTHRPFDPASFPWWKRLLWRWLFAD
jgi:hypothetical protein